MKIIDILWNIILIIMFMEATIVIITGIRTGIRKIKSKNTEEDKDFVSLDWSNAKFKKF